MSPVCNWVESDFSKIVLTSYKKVRQILVDLDVFLFFPCPNVRCISFTKVMIILPVMCVYFFDHIRANVSL